MTTKINTHNFAEVVQYALNYRDSYTAGHQKRVAELAVLIGRRAGLDEAKIHELYIGGMLHDIGKIGIPRKILNKKDSLTEEEFMEIKNHPKIGFELIKDENFPWSVKDMVLHHHERLDGSGYPDGLRGKEISLETRIITVCDVTEAMSTERVYRAARTRSEVIKELTAGRKIRYDDDIAGIMIELINTGIYNPWGSS
ncbi:MAG: HD-GYP domain-containing protein [Caldicoprobacterales bacterium]|jgi:putative nucleotidyltransferase with HDIG domain|nr:HD-GYP domain-containing protein [Clostridiales bacterium]